MANLIFPPAPTTGQEFIGTFGEIYTWDGEKWTLTSAGPVVPTPPPAAVGPTPPASPASGDLWWDTISGQLFIWYIDANSAQWVVANVSVGVPGPAGPAGPNVMPPGVTDGSNAAAGQVGEYIYASESSNTIIANSTMGTSVITINLTAGDWDVCGVAGIVAGSAVGISFTSIAANIKINDVVPPLAGTGPSNFPPSIVAALSLNSQRLPCGPIRASLSAPGTAVLGVQTSWTGTLTSGNVFVSGWIAARRMR